MFYDIMIVLSGISIVIGVFTLVIGELIDSKKNIDSDMGDEEYYEKIQQMISELDNGDE